MTDKNRNVDQTLKRQIEESYGASDGQLKARMDRIEKTLTEDEFAGAEDRIMAKLMARITEEESKTETVEEPVVEVEAESEAQVEKEESVTVTCFGRKKIFLVAAVAAAFIGVLGVTAIGEKSYFFRENNCRVETIFNNTHSISNISNLENAYKEIRDENGGDIFTLHYIPSTVKFDKIYFENGKAIIELKEGNNYLYFVQYKKDIDASVVLNSDRSEFFTVKNEWLNLDIEYIGNLLEDGLYEYEAQVEYNGSICWIFGKMEREEYENILKYLFFN